VDAKVHGKENPVPKAKKLPEAMTKSKPGKRKKRGALTVVMYLYKIRTTSKHENDTKTCARSYFEPRDRNYIGNTHAKPPQTVF
jgi:hypothetical protein